MEARQARLDTLRKEPRVVRAELDAFIESYKAAIKDSGLSAETQQLLLDHCFSSRVKLMCVMITQPTTEYLLDNPFLRVFELPPNLWVPLSLFNELKTAASGDFEHFLEMMPKADELPKESAAEPKESVAEPKESAASKVDELVEASQAQFSEAPPASVLAGNSPVGQDTSQPFTDEDAWETLSQMSFLSVDYDKDTKIARL